MTSDNHNGLTTYQRAILTHLGIVPWRLRSSITEIADTSSTQTASLQREAGLKKLKEVVSATNKAEKPVTLIPDQVLILTTVKEKNSLFIQDVLQAAGLESKQICFSQISQKQQFTDYKFSWSILDTPIEEENQKLAELVGHNLTTKQINAENAMALKKQLWKILQNHTSQS